MSQRVDIQPQMIVWAIRRAGRDVEDYVAEFPETQKWLDREAKPTVRQLEGFARRLHVPFGYLFLPEPPVERLPIPFFRTGRGAVSTVSLNVRDAILALMRRQEWLSSYLQENGAEPLPFVGRFNVQRQPEEIAADMRATLSLTPEWASQLPNWSEAKSYLVRKIEELGVVVSFNSVVENNVHRKIDPDECRGFILVDAYAPWLFVNSADSKAAQMFTLAHELAHLWVGQSAGFDAQQMLPADDPLEQLCDRAAAEFLVPAKSLLDFWRDTPDYARAARHFKVSELVVARRALDLELIGKKAFFEFYQRARLTQKKPVKGGGDFYQTQKARIGLPFLAHLAYAAKTGSILYHEAYHLAGLKGEVFHKLTRRVL